jgi:hypothetical protein
VVLTNPAASSEAGVCGALRNRLAALRLSSGRVDIFANPKIVLDEEVRIRMAVDEVNAGGEATKGGNPVEPKLAVDVAEFGEMVGQFLLL